jgi:hypothetical protein
MIENLEKNENSKLDYQYRKVHGIMGEISYSIIIPKLYAMDIGIRKGDSVKVTHDSKKIIIEKA